MEDGFLVLNVSLYLSEECALKQPMDSDDALGDGHHATRTQLGDSGAETARHQPRLQA